MFQAFFLRDVACPEGEGPDAALVRYGYQFGLPTAAHMEALFKASREILCVSTWPGYYSRLVLRVPSKQEQAERLRRYIDASAFCGYHTPSVQVFRRSPAGRNKAGRQPLATVARRAPAPPRERTGVQQDLRRAFASAPAARQARPVGAKAAAAKAATQPKGAPRLEVRNKFASLDMDSDTE